MVKKLCIYIFILLNIAFVNGMDQSSFYLSTPESDDISESQDSESDDISIAILSIILKKNLVA
jgi:hypothetical protein